MPSHKKHLAGIIPLANLEDKLGFPYHPSLAPVYGGYLAVEAAVHEAAWAGCNTIWIVCNDDVQPLVRHRVGEYTYDPAFMDRSKWDRFPSQSRKTIPIYYTGLLSKDIGKRDCYAYSIIHGAQMAIDVSRAVSHWADPDKFYVSFPMGVYNPKALGYYRKEINKPGKAFGWRYEGKTVKDGEHLGFAFTHENLKDFRKRIMEGTGTYSRETLANGFQKKLPSEERNSGRHFSLDKVFQDVIFNEQEGFLRDISWYHKIDNWTGYRDYLASEHWYILKHPGKIYTKYREFNQIGVDDIDNSEE